MNLNKMYKTISVRMYWKVVAMPGGPNDEINLYSYTHTVYVSWSLIVYSDSPFHDLAFRKSAFENSPSNVCHFVY